MTTYHIDVFGRAAASITAFGILPRFTGVAVHDTYTGYDAFTAATRVSTASEAGNPKTPNEDWALATEGLIVVLDGATARP